MHLFNLKCTINELKINGGKNSFNIPDLGAIFQIKKSDDRGSTLRKQLNESAQKLEEHNSSIVRLEDKLREMTDTADTTSNKLRTEQELTQQLKVREGVSRRGSEHNLKCNVFA